MRVLYDDEGLTTLQEATIGLAPTLVGLVGALAWVTVVGVPTVTPLTVAVGAAWLLYTLPSGDDTSAAGDLLAPEGGFGEPRRSILIGMGAMAIGAWMPALPYPSEYTISLVYAFMVAGMLYIGFALWKHGMPDTRKSVVD